MVPGINPRYVSSGDECCTAPSLKLIWQDDEKLGDSYGPEVCSRFSEPSIMGVFNPIILFCMSV